MKLEKIKFTTNKPENFNPLKKNQKVELNKFEKEKDALWTIAKIWKRYGRMILTTDIKKEVLSQAKSVLIDIGKIEYKEQKFINEIIEECQKELKLTSYKTYIPEITKNTSEEKIDKKSINYCSKSIEILKKSVEELQKLEEESQKLEEEKEELVKKLSISEITTDEYTKIEEPIYDRILDILSEINKIKEYIKRLENYIKLDKKINSFSMKNIEPSNFIQKFDTIESEITSNEYINDRERSILIHNLNYYFFEKVKEEKDDLEKMKNIFQEKYHLLNSHNIRAILPDKLEKIKEGYDTNTLLELLELGEKEVIDPSCIFNFIYCQIIPIIDTKYDLNIEKKEKERDELIDEIAKIIEDEVGEIGYKITWYKLEEKIFPIIKWKIKSYDDKVISWAAEKIKQENKLWILRENVVVYCWTDEDKLKKEINNIKEKIPKEENSLIKVLMEIFVEHAHKNYLYNKKLEEWKIKKQAEKEEEDNAYASKGKVPTRLRTHDGKWTNSYNSE